MRPVRTFSVTPKLPPQLEPLRDLAYNLRWAWNQDTIALFRRLSDDIWENSRHNPVLMLGTIDQTRLEAAAADEGFLTHLDRVASDLKSYSNGGLTWFRRTHDPANGPAVAYFSAEFGLTDCLSIFAGGLGLLAGDHLKSASDLGIPLVGVGLLYQQGYFRQYLGGAGWHEAYEDNDFYNLPLTLERAADGTPLTVDIPMPGRVAMAQIWRAQVGRVRLYLLDTNVGSNTPEDCRITDKLYGGDQESRIKQEVVLGIGGYRALEALGLCPIVFHMNEGHAALLGLERIRRIIEQHDLSFAEAREEASAGLVFTTHTPVEAGHDVFPPHLMDRYLSGYAEALRLSRGDFLALGRSNPHDEGEPFHMTILALRLSAYSNGVSELHGNVSRRMWRGIWPDVPEDEVPIGHVTNGVHVRSWISGEMDQLYDRYLGARWKEEPADQAAWQRVERVPPEELWRTHERRRERLVAFSRSRLRTQLQQRGAFPSEIEAAGETLDLDALTIGFARRFATYKRAGLLLHDPDRLARILNDPDRPVQVIFSGKAHPRDAAGKELIRQIANLAREERFRRRLVFLENYDMTTARYLVQGCDVWLNTPRRPFEASATSGMKAAANGVLNLSTLDGWWAEAWEKMNSHPIPIGWAIGHGETYENPEYQDQVEAEALYGLLERDVVPTFYNRGVDGLPRHWIARMKASIGRLCHFFNTHRMLHEYTDKFYLPAATRYHELGTDRLGRARALAAWLERVRSNWHQIRIEMTDSEPTGGLEVGDQFPVRARVYLGHLTAEDVLVQLYVGRLNGEGQIVDGHTIAMAPIESTADSIVFEATNVVCQGSGLHGYTVRVLPDHRDLITPYQPGLIVWAEADNSAG